LKFDRVGQKKFRNTNVVSEGDKIDKHREYIDRTLKHLGQTDKTRLKEMAEFYIAYHHYDERICKSWYDMCSKAKKEGKQIVRFPTRISAETAKECKYQESDQQSWDNKFYHCVPNISYRTFSELVITKEKEAFYKNINNGKKLLMDSPTNISLKDKRKYSPVAVEALEKDDEAKQKKRKKDEEKKETTEFFDSITKISDKGIKITVRNKFNEAEEKIKSLEDSLRSTQALLESAKREIYEQKSQLEENMKRKKTKRPSRQLERFNTVADAKENSIKKYKVFAKRVAEKMVKCIKKLKGGKEDVQGTLKAGLEVISSEYDLANGGHESELIMINTLKKSIQENMNCEYFLNTTTIISLAVELMKKYTYKKMAELLCIPMSRIKRAITHAQNSFPGAPCVKKKKFSGITIPKETQDAFLNFLTDDKISYEAPATRINRIKKTTKILVNSRKGKNH
jgi:hypothetical protein